MLCAKCNYDNPADALFCMKCGAKVENRCSSCNTVNPADARFCRKCGGALGTGAPASSPSPATAAQTPRDREGGGDEECVVFYSVRGNTDVLFELLDDNLNIVGTLTVRDFIEALEQQKNAV